MTSKNTPKNVLSLCEVSDTMKLKLIRTQLEFARNFYDDLEFCPLPYIDEVSEHRDRIKRRLLPSQLGTSNGSSKPDLSSRPYRRRASMQVSTNNSVGNPRFNNQHIYSSTIAMPSFVQPSRSISATTTNTSKAIPIIDPNSRAPVTVQTSAGNNNRNVAVRSVSEATANQYWNSIQCEAGQLSNSSSNSSNSSDSPKSHYGNNSAYFLNNNDFDGLSGYNGSNATRVHPNLRVEYDNKPYHSTTNNYQTYSQLTTPGSKLYHHLHSPPQEMTPDKYHCAAREQLHYQHQHTQAYPSAHGSNTVPIVDHDARQALWDHQQYQHTEQQLESSLKYYNVSVY